MLKISPKSKIYILCQAQYATGGTEAIHQLADKLRKFRYNAFIVYSPRKENPVPESFRIYNTKNSEIIEDNEANLLIAPEGWISKLKPYKKIQKAIWWLSVDNAEKNTSQLGAKVSSRWENLKKVRWIVNTYKILNRRGKISFDFSEKENRKMIHFAQSAYAENFLNANGACEIYPLSDYLNKCFRHEDNAKKENSIIYNPKKGGEITSKLIKQAPELKWVPLQNMTPKHTAKAMEKAKVYIDFGEHPGKDRIPREAAMKGCCVIVGLKGSARFFQDIPIPREYKFKADPVNSKKVIAKIKDCLNNYEKRKDDFENYRRIISMNEEKFEREIRQAFGTRKK